VTKVLSKKDLVTKFLSAAPDSTVYVHLDPRHPLAVIPNNLKAKSSMILQFGYNMPLAIPDLFVSDGGIQGTLSFKGVPFVCFVPFDSVYAIVNDEGAGQIWGDEMPTEVRDHMAREAEKAKAASNMFRKLDGTYDLDAYRAHRHPSKATPWRPGA